MTYYKMQSVVLLLLLLLLLPAEEWNCCWMDAFYGVALIGVEH